MVVRGATTAVQGQKQAEEEGEEGESPLITVSLRVGRSSTVELTVVHSSARYINVELCM